MRRDGSVRAEFPSLYRKPCASLQYDGNRVADGASLYRDVFVGPVHG
jgi:hypothetical protein